ncbi:MAG: molybdenum ABC transporter ATP-binding protein [Candidatus Scalindua sp. AMX11]|nr:MAG: molybdenum ABC transporter ATP-binding protein [Candidatus Scalindua sp.]NOG83175.1 molybdenum ABC transporter ATP-binding protein [Planctomycetota bacterium]RZV77542.1 MAG: molybdenum ABC transporter ATP-binding protein [Candidatus Scalindua sp. SCAELEC01]TDE64578.1 MAG: molybdenum ABC transporter ATP-binding protein [Candidatus Scalindua sp. AMX11]GJQ58605.1 MAG: molybdenum import ATP-binding protein ModC [Candidatus Scalindua sp.]
MSIKIKLQVTRQEFVLDVDLDIPERGVTAIFGPSGCGKTTLLRAISGLEKSLGGFLKVGGTVWQEHKHVLPAHRRPLGYVFQEASLFPHLNVRRNLEYGVKRVPEAERKISLKHIIRLLKIEHLLERKPSYLSGGERQRVAIARALAVSPQLLLMDEPLASLDLKSRQEILPYIESLHREFDIPVIYVSHSTDEVARLADYLVLLEAGRVTAAGAISDMLTRLDLPLAHGRDAEALIEATVSGHDENYHLTYLDSAGGRFTVINKELQVGSSVRLRIAARDVSLTLEPQSRTSIQNIFPATVEEIVPEGNAQVTICLMMGGVPLLACITRKSASELDLKPNKLIYAQVKSVSLLS